MFTYHQRLPCERPHRHFFSRLSPVVDGIYTLFTACVQRGNYPSCEILGMPPECGDSPPGGSNAFLGFFVFLEYLLRRPTTDKSFARETRIKQESSRIRSHARARVVPSPTRESLCAQWLETKLVKQHPHVETWTFQRIYKVPLARPC